MHDKELKINHVKFIIALLPFSQRINYGTTHTVNGNEVSWESIINKYNFANVDGVWSQREHYVGRRYQSLAVHHVSSPSVL